MLIPDVTPQSQGRSLTCCLLLGENCSMVETWNIISFSWYWAYTENWPVESAESMKHDVRTTNLAHHRPQHTSVDQTSIPAVDSRGDVFKHVVLSRLVLYQQTGVAVQIKYGGLKTRN